MRGRRLRRIGATLVTVAGLTVIGALATGEMALVTTHGVSMEPRFHTGDLAVLVPSSHYHVGEIVGYHSPLLHIVVLHRIVAEHDGLFTFKGDNNSFLDPVHVGPAAIEGRLWLHIVRGGVVLGWVRSPLVLGVLAFLVIALGVGGAARRRRARGPTVGPNPSGAVSHPSGTGSVAVQWWPIAVAGSLVAVFSLMTLTSWTMSASRPSESALPYDQHAAFSYGGIAPAGVTYPTGFVTTGDPVFLHLVDWLDVEVHYAITSGESSPASASEPAVRGTIGASAEVTGPGGWTGHLTSVTPVDFSGSSAIVDVPLDLTKLPALEQAFESETGVSLVDPDIVVKPVVHVHGTMFGDSLSDTFKPTLTFGISGQVLEVTTTSAGVGGANSTQMAVDLAGSVDHGTLVPAHMSILGRSAAVGTVRQLGLAGLLLSMLALFGAIFWRRRRLGMEESDRIRATYGRDLVSLSSNPESAAPFVVDVETFDELAQLARRYDCVILEWAQADARTYYVESGTTLYRCGIGNAPVQVPLVLDEIGQIPTTEAEEIPVESGVEVAAVDTVDETETETETEADSEAEVQVAAVESVAEATPVEFEPRLEPANGMSAERALAVVGPMASAEEGTLALGSLFRPSRRIRRSARSQSDTDPATEVNVLTCLARAEWVSGVGDAHTHLHQAATLARQSGLDEAMIETLLVNVRTAFNTEQTSDPEKLGLLEYALGLPGGTPARRARLLGALAVESLFSGGSRSRQSLLEEATELARRSGEPQALIDVSACRFLAHPRSTWSTAEFNRDRSLFTEGLNAAVTLGDPLSVATMQTHAAFYSVIGGDGERLRTQISALSETSGGGQNQIALRAQLLLDKTVATLEGRLDDADALSTEASDLRRMTGLAETDVTVAMSQLALRREQVRLPELIPAFTDDATGRPPGAAAVAATAFARAESGYRHDAAVLLDRAYQAGFEAIPDDIDWPVAVALWSEVAFQVHHRPAAGALHEILLPHDGLQMSSAGVACGPAARLLALLEIVLDQPNDADRHFGEAIDFGRGMRSPVWMARCQLDWAQTWMDRGEVAWATQLTDDADTTAGMLALPALQRQWMNLRDQLDRE
jgi:signal peptidase I